jgi:hypothetical protein
MHLRAGWPESHLNKSNVLGRVLATTPCRPASTELRSPIGLRFFASRSIDRTRLRARRLPQPAAGPANGGGSEVLSVVPLGGSSEASFSDRLRIDWNNRRALIRVTLC